MFKVFDKNAPVKAAMERVMEILLPEDANVVFANVENFNDVKVDVEAGTPVIFYGFDSEASLRLRGDPSAPWFYSKNAAYFQLPSLLPDMIVMYDKIIKGKKIENKAVILAARFGYKQNLVGRLLHDIWPGKYGCEEGLNLAEKEFSIKGTIEQVREQLEKLRGKDVGQAKEIVGDEMIPGVFCDVEGTLISVDRTKVNSDLVVVLGKEETDKPVTLWTGGDVKEIEKLLVSHGIKKYPVVSKDVFRGCKVEIVYDDLPKAEFKKQYNITAKKYIKI